MPNRQNRNQREIKTASLSEEEGRSGCAAAGKLAPFSPHRFLVILSSDMMLLFAAGDSCLAVVYVFGHLSTVIRAQFFSHHLCNVIKL